MNLGKIISILDAEVLCNGNDIAGVNISMACGSDLMSDVLAFIKSDALLLTGLTTPQVIYSAENSGVEVICFVRGKRPLADTVDLAKEKGIILLTTRNLMFESCGRLYNNGLKGCSESGIY